MEYTWDLSIFYNDYTDLKYQNDIAKIEERIEQLNQTGRTLSKEQVCESLTAFLKIQEELNLLIEEVYGYSSLRISADVNDVAAAKEIGKIQVLLQKTVPANVLFDKFLKEIDLSVIDWDPFLKSYRFLLKEEQKRAQHLLSDPEEVLISKLSMVASDSWSELQSKLTSNLSVKVKGFPERMPLSAVRNLAYDASSQVRKNAYRAELKSYESIQDAVAMALNNIKREVNIICELRGYPDALEMTLQQSAMSRKTLNAMIEAIKEELPHFRKYYQIKAKALKHRNGLPFYDLFAPLGSLTKTFTFEQAKEMVLDVYRSFSEELYQMGKTAFENRWIDVLPREGKVGGAFCAGALNHHQSRVLTNFNGSLGDVQTLAHELGHAYHNHIIYQNEPLNRNFPMPLAETASILCQTLMSKKIARDMTDPLEKITVLEQSLQEDTQCIVDILSRFLFENKVLNTPVSIPLSARDLCQMMVEAQKESYGDGLDMKYLHPYMWLCKSHYYSTFSFYNWPYAFGLLYGKGLYRNYQKNPKQFVENYDRMLRNTALMSVEEVAETMGIHIEEKSFWKESLKTIEEDIDALEALLAEHQMI